ncbi:MAG: hypothetical protein IKD66_06480 [Solobacterium sp.]|nr:hypothetical protein [Solobacterium sp.]
MINKRSDNNNFADNHWMILSAAGLLQSAGERQSEIGRLCRSAAEDVMHSISTDQTGFETFGGGRITGFAAVCSRIFGAAAERK